ncbi:MAG: hypothetical protein JWQ73_1920 [Variovorax sp.]|nr:hypothetical protein [Variovorax sp.]
MTTESDQPEDIAGLFRKFGGDPMAYKEFAPRDEPGASSGAWPLVSPIRPPAEAAQATPPAPAYEPPPVQRVPMAQPAPAKPRTVTAARPPEAVSALFAAPSPTLHAVGAPTGTPTEPRELDALFARLLGTPPPAVPTGHGLLSRWRSPS